MELREEKMRLIRELAIQGADKEKFDFYAKRLGVGVEPKYLKRWKRKLWKTVEPFELPSEPRLVNRFMLGADPEFVAADKKNGGYVHAKTLGFTTLMPFGCDMSGRQCELRAAPSRFALEVLASLTETLRWMGAYSNVVENDWLSVAYFGRDGVGGHIHFGRRRNDMKQSVRALDRITQTMLSMDILDARGQEQRTENTQYGRYGDHRPQMHGFEYRTMPTWLNSPLCAYTALVLSKLFVYDKTICDDIYSSKNKKNAILTVLGHYKDIDDDAKILLAALQTHGFPKYTAVDFKPAWGVGCHQTTDAPLPTYYPTALNGSSDTVKQLFEHLVNGKDIIIRAPLVTWENPFMPDGYSMMKVKPHVFSIPEIAKDLVVKDCIVEIISANSNQLEFQYNQHILELDQRRIKKFMLQDEELKGIPVVFQDTSRNGYGPEFDKQLWVKVPRTIHDHDTHVGNKELQRALRRLFTSGLFPVAKGSEIEMLKDFRVLKATKEAIPVRKFIGKIIEERVGG